VNDPAMASKRCGRTLCGGRLSFTMFGAVVCAFGILLWSRLLLVTKPPRVAMAEPTPALLEDAPNNLQTPHGANPGRAPWQPQAQPARPAQPAQPAQPAEIP